MGKGVDDSVLDAGLDALAVADRIVLLDSGAPANYAAATVGGENHIAIVTVTAGLGNSDWGSAEDGEGLASTGGRSTLLAAQTTGAATATKTATHIAALVVASEKILGINELSVSLAATEGSPLDIDANEWNFADPS